MDYQKFDQRGYRVLPARQGYGEWALTYEETPLEAMDIRLLERVRLGWPNVQRALDLACGTGRIGSWLAERGVHKIEGIDFTPEMLERARARGVYDKLVDGSVEDTGLPSSAYDLITMSLADEHLPRLEPVYSEAARLIASDGHFIVVGYHPHFLLNGMPTHYHRPDGEAVAIESHIHLLSDHVRAAHQSKWSLVTMDEALIGDDWIARKPSWERWRDHPVSYLLLWKRRH